MKDFERDWQKVLDFFKQKFTTGETPELDTILFLIGVQELGMIKPEFSKEEKLNLMHIATCKLLEPYGYYQFHYRDSEGWPHFKKLKELDSLNDQERFIKEAVINYFINNALI